MQGSMTDYLLSNRKNLAAWLVLAGILVAVVVLAILDDQAEQLDIA